VEVYVAREHILDEITLKGTETLTGSARPRKEWEPVREPAPL